MCTPVRWDPTIALQLAITICHDFQVWRAKAKTVTTSICGRNCWTLYARHGLIRINTLRDVAVARRLPGKASFRLEKAPSQDKLLVKTRQTLPHLGVLHVRLSPDCRPAVSVVRSDRPRAPSFCVGRACVEGELSRGACN